MSVETPTDPEDILGEPARVSLNNEDLGAGRITAADHVGNGEHRQLRVTVSNANGEMDVAFDRVEITPRDDIVQLVREECRPPDMDGTPSTMVSYPSLLRACQRTLDKSLDELDGLMREAIIARELSVVRWDGTEVIVGASNEGTRHLFPVEERYVYNVIGEFSRAKTPRGEIIEHCRMLLEDELGQVVYRS